MNATSQLMIWPDDERGIPNALVRSALFNVDQIRAGERDVLVDAEVLAMGNLNITYSGQQLRQDDADVWLQLVHMGRDNLARPIEFTCNAMLTELGWSRRTGNRLRLAKTIERLQWTRVKITKGEEGYGGPLIFSFKWREHDAELRTWTVRLNNDLADLFALTQRTRLDWETRLSLSPLEKWLHGFYMSHRDPFPISIELLLKLTKSNCSTLKDWRDLVREAMDKLVLVGAIESYSLDGRMLSVNRPLRLKKEHLPKRPGGD